MLFRSYVETIFPAGTRCRTHFKLIQMKNLTNVNESKLRGENKQNKVESKLQNSSNVNINRNYFVLN